MVYTAFKNWTSSSGDVSLARAVKPAISANKIDAYLLRSVKYRASVDSSRGVFKATATVTLQNQAPAEGLASYVIGNATKDPPGTNRTYLSMYTAFPISSVRLDGQPINDIKLQDLRRAIGYVAQDTFLADATVAENIAYGMQGTPREAIVQAAQAAEAHDFISALPQGYDTQVGERGMKLSGGQRQRLALARAILKNPPILILDEATSAVDNETEAAIQRSLDRLVVGRTSLIIAHRLSTVRHAHCIHVLDRGRIVESGTHDELVARGGIYAALWRLQTGEKQNL